MSDESLYAAMRAYIDIAVELRVTKALETRSAPTVIEGPAGKPGVDGSNGKDGKDGRDGVDGKDGNVGAPGIGEKGERGADGVNGKDGAPSTVPGPKGDTGERGADGIATLEDVRAAAKEVFADFQVRTFADIYKGVYKPGEAYTRSNFTTWGGSLWMALADTKGKPGETTDWRLVVKR